MAKKFFNSKVASRKRNLVNGVIISICVIGVAVCLYFTQYYDFGGSEETSVKLQDSISLEIFSSPPANDIFFSSLSGVDEDDIEVDMSAVDFNSIGSYIVVVSVEGSEYEVTLNIVDATSPTLELNELVIEDGETYILDDFIVSCTDNSNDECLISYDTSSVTENGDSIDFSSYYETGTYTITIKASDSSGNTAYKSTTLTIGDVSSAPEEPEEDPEVTSCTYGTNSYDEDNYLLTYNVSTNGCAISLDSYLNESVQEPINSIADTETTKIKTEINTIADLDSSLHINRSINAITNLTGNGFVGYSLLISVTNEDGDVIVSYYLDENSYRYYLVNPYNLD